MFLDKWEETHAGTGEHANFTVKGGAWPADSSPKAFWCVLTVLKTVLVCSYGFPALNKKPHVFSMCIRSIASWGTHYWGHFFVSLFMSAGHEISRNSKTRIVCHFVLTKQFHFPIYMYSLAWGDRTQWDLTVLTKYSTTKVQRKCNTAVSHTTLTAVINATLSGDCNTDASLISKLWASIIYSLYPNL